MRKKTYVFEALKPEATLLLASGASMTAAARQLGVDRATIHRWVKAGRLARPARRGPRRITAPSPAQVAPGAPLTPADWAESVRTAYDLNPTEVALVELAEAALALAHDPEARPSDRLAAMARFGALVKQINLEDQEESNGEAENSTASVHTFPHAG